MTAMSIQMLDPPAFPKPSRFERVVAFVAGLLGFSVAPKGDDALISSYVKRLEETVKGLAQDLREAFDERRATEQAVKTAIYQAGVNREDLDDGLSVSDTVAQAISVVVADRSTQRVNQLTDLVKRIAIAHGFNEDDRPSEAQLFDAIQSLHDCNAQNERMIRALTDFEVMKEDGVVQGRMINVMTHFLLLMLNGGLKETPHAPAQNHVTFQIGPRDEDGSGIEVMVRRINGKTDTQVRQEVEAKLAAALDTIDNLEFVIRSLEALQYSDDTVTSTSLPFANDEQFPCTPLAAANDDAPIALEFPCATLPEDLPAELRQGLEEIKQTETRLYCRERTGASGGAANYGKSSK